MPDQADEINKLQAAIERVSNQLVSIEERLNALEQGQAPRSTTAHPVPLDSALHALPARPRELESRLGLTLINRIGAITLAIGIVFFFKYAVDNKWITASGRVLFGLVTGIALIAFADWLRNRDQRVFSQGVCGCGLAIVYISLYASFAYYQLLPQALAFTAMVAACVLAGVLSFRYDHPAIAALGLVGGFLTPPLLQNGHDHAWILFTYLTLLDAASLAIGTRKRWPVLNVIAFLGTAITFLVWAGAAHGRTFGVGLFFLCTFFALFSTASINGYRTAQRNVYITLLCLNAFWALLSAGVLSHGPEDTWLALFAGLLAVAHVTAAYRHRNYLRLYVVLYVIAHACLLVAVLRELYSWGERHIVPATRDSFLSESVSVFLALYAVAMIMSGIARRFSVDRIVGLVLMGVVIAKLYLYDVWLLARFYRISAFVVLGILLLSASYIYSRFKNQVDLLLK